MKKLVVLISNSGTGSNLQAIINAIRTKDLNARIVTVLCDRDDAPGLHLAQEAHIPIAICHDKETLLPMLQALSPDFVVMAGWKQFIPATVIDSYPRKILNLHPGIIPDSPNSPEKNPDGTTALWNEKMFTDAAIQNILTNKATYAGSSIHFLTHTFDFGSVLGRTFEKVEADDTIKSLYTRLKKKENSLYVQVLKRLCNTT